MTDLDQSELEKYKWLVRSQMRIKRLKRLKNPKTISQLSQIFDVEIDTMQKQVKDLRDKNLVKAINPEDNKGILYRQTSEAEMILEKAQSEV